LKQKEKPEYRFFCLGEVFKKSFQKKNSSSKICSKNKIFFKQLGTLVDVVTFTSGGCLKGGMVLFREEKKIVGNRNFGN
jgi:hypothetical protein